MQDAIDDRPPPLFTPSDPGRFNQNAPGARQPLELLLQEPVPVVADRPGDRPAKEEEGQRPPEVLAAAALPRRQQVAQHRDDGGGERLGRDGPPHEAVVVERQQPLRVALCAGLMEVAVGLRRRGRDEMGNVDGIVGSVARELGLTARFLVVLRFVAGRWQSSRSSNAPANAQSTPAQRTQTQYRAPFKTRLLALSRVLGFPPSLYIKYDDKTHPQRGLARLGRRRWRRRLLLGGRRCSCS